MSKNEDIKDYLEVDEALPGQNYYCLSIINPETTLKKKEEFLFHNYYKSKIQEHKQRLKSNVESALTKGSNGTIKVVDLLHLVKNMNKGFELDTCDFESFKDKYEDFLFNSEKELNKKFDEENKFQTSVRGIKIRGTYASYEEAEKRAKLLQKIDSNFDVYVGQVGYWVPLVFNGHHIENQEHANNDLNSLMKS